MASYTKGGPKDVWWLAAGRGSQFGHFEFQSDYWIPDFFLPLKTLWYFRWRWMIQNNNMYMSRNIHIYIYILCTQSDGIFIARTLHETPALKQFHHSQKYWPPSPTTQKINHNFFNAGGTSPNAQQEKKTRLEISQKTPEVEPFPLIVDLMPLNCRKTQTEATYFVVTFSLQTYSEFD